MPGPVERAVAVAALVVAQGPQRRHSGPANQRRVLRYDVTGRRTNQHVERQAGADGVEVGGGGGLQSDAGRKEYIISQ